MSLLWVKTAGKTYYHASPAELPKGTILKPGGPDGETNTFGTSKGGKHVFINRDYDDAHHWAHMLSGAVSSVGINGYRVQTGDGSPIHVYRVTAPESTRHSEKDSLGGYEHHAPWARVEAKDHTVVGSDECAYC